MPVQTRPQARTPGPELAPTDPDRRTLITASSTTTSSGDAAKFAATDKQNQIVPDEHNHEHATCFNVKGKGLVVITSCGHAGIINTIRQAQDVSGVRKLHALLGGFHLGPAKPEYAAKSVAELKTLEPDVVIPMHCSGMGFVQEVRNQMPDKLLLSTTGSRMTFTS